MADSEHKIIGRSDRVDLPELGVEDIPAKIDTGAYRSSLHCEKIGLEGDQLCFTLRTAQGDQQYRTEEWEEKVVKSSNGKAQKRFVIKTPIRLFGKNYKTTISLTDRSKMRNPLLIGRKMLKGRFMVDVSKKDLSHKEKVKK